VGCATSPARVTAGADDANGVADVDARMKRTAGADAVCAMGGELLPS
jgi:hypothetical protein